MTTHSTITEQRQEQTAQALREHIASELAKCGLKVCPKGARR